MLLSRKRSAEEAYLTSQNDHRLQNGRRREEQPPAANYKMDVPPFRHIDVTVQPRHVPDDWTMSPDLYNRDSDNGIPVDFPGLHDTGSHGSPTNTLA